MREFKLCAIIVFFRPNSDQVTNAERISTFCPVIAIDNSDTVLPTTKVLQYIHLGGNKGIAVAQNIGVQIARERGFEYVIFLDQDSEISASAIDKLTEIFIKKKNVDADLGAIGPLVVNKETGKLYKNNIDKDRLTMVKSMISSGMIVPMNVLDEVGGFEETFFIDMVDHEWCWRCVNKGYHLYIASEIQLMHQVGNGVTNIMGLQFIWSAPFRYFYKYRNSIWLFSRSYVPISWKIRTFLRMPLDLFIFLIGSFYNYQNYERLKYALSGIIAAFVKNTEK